MQETLWVASQKIGTLRVGAAFVSWLFQVVRNQCYRLLHLKKHEEGLPDLDQVEASPELQILLQQDIVKALAMLPVPYRRVLIMRDVDDLSGPEVAAKLGLTVATVKSRLHHGRKLLRDSLAHWNE